MNLGKKHTLFNFLTNMTQFSDTPCTNNPCLNQGQCQVVGNSFQCTCRTGFFGDRCQSEFVHSILSNRYVFIITDQDYNTCQSCEEYVQNKYRQGLNTNEGKWSDSAL